MDLHGYDACFAVGLGDLQTAIVTHFLPAWSGSISALPINATHTTNVADAQSTLRLPAPASLTADPATGRLVLTVTGDIDLSGVVVTSSSAISDPGVGLAGILNTITAALRPTLGAVVAQLVDVPIATPTAGTLAIRITLEVTGNETSGFLSFAPVDVSATVTGTVVDSAAIATALGGAWTRAFESLIAIAASRPAIPTAAITTVATTIANDVVTAVRNGIQRALRGVNLPIALHVPGMDPARCNIGLWKLDAKLLPAGTMPATQPCLALLTRLLPPPPSGATDADTRWQAPPTLSAITASPLPTGRNVGVFLDNFFLLSAVTCAAERLPVITPSLGTPNVPPTRPELTAAWNVPRVANVGGQAVTIRAFNVAIAPTPMGGGEKQFTFATDIDASGDGWTAHIHVAVNVRLQLTDGQVQPVITSTVTHTLDAPILIALEATAIALAIIAAILAAVFIAGVIAAAAAATAAAVLIAVTIAVVAAVGAVITGLVAGVVWVVREIIRSIIEGLVSALTGAISGITGLLGDAFLLIPPEIMSFIGRPLFSHIVFDDLELSGSLAAPVANHPSYLGGAADVTIAPGQAFDLDREAVVSLSDPGVDVQWSAGRMSVLNGAAAGRIVGLAMPYWTVGIEDVQALAYPAGVGTPVLDLRIPISDSEPPAGFVFAARTGQGHYARCKAWRDRLGRLHLRYDLFRSIAALDLESTWTTRRGSGVDGLGGLPAYEISRTGNFHAVTHGGPTPVRFRWFWNGAELGATTGPLPASGIQRITTLGDRCTVTSIMGQPVTGTICATAVYASGREATVCRDLEFAGSEVDSDVLRHVVQRDPAEILREWLKNPWPGPDPAPDAFVDRIREVMTSTPAKLAFDVQLAERLGRGGR